MYVLYVALNIDPSYRLALVIYSSYRYTFVALVLLFLSLEEASASFIDSNSVENKATKLFSKFIQQNCAFALDPQHNTITSSKSLRYLRESSTRTVCKSATFKLTIDEHIQTHLQNTHTLEPHTQRDIN